MPDPFVNSHVKRQYIPYRNLSGFYQYLKYFPPLFTQTVSKQYLCPWEAVNEKNPIKQ